MSFEEAALAFFDENAVELFDEANSEVEIRYQLIGISNTRLIFVAYTERNEKVRIISARKANAKQMRIYNEQND
ncbi:MAG: BrnT family toxin [Pyrinomonadaceae bacterium]|nr:BrnT family toxin [Pyrinomonadaceae bacterium]